MAKISRLDSKLSAGRTGLVLFDALNGYLHPQDNPAKVQFFSNVGSVVTAAGSPVM